MSHETGSALSIRPVESTDCQLLWEWANDPAVRAASFHGEPIPWVVHEAWFGSRIRNSACRIYIVTADGAPIGQVRFERQRQESPMTTIDISLAQPCRRMGFGVEALQLACLEYRRESRSCIAADVKSSNAASMKVFERAGFAFRGVVKTEGEDAVRWVLPADAPVRHE
jgi:RimJ/RimL family protein N-acetyltransferase